ncbi:polyisoprenoid-binding protein [Rhodopseudomonas palustris]|uniref:Polyisoprenoid-binding protein n=1 Tax=Rhodopseudomonas palustris TaxID=1076 RepID=A0A323UVL4_RHOPL|nr:YceI family protein [Rhodopseudomonas palustris]PZA11668.1 polyisoprenoid-binding protein [Rhodopseudomonas palustris]
MIQRRLLFPILAAALAVAPAAFAETAPKAGAKIQAAKTEPVKVESGTYAIDPDHTQVGFVVSHMGFSEFRGRFGDVSGTLQLDGANPAKSSFDIKLPTASVNTPIDKLTTELTAADWLDAKANPEIRFTSQAVTVTGPRQAKVTGELTLHGVTKKVTLDARLHGAGVNPLNKKVTVGFDLTGTIKRSEFGVTKYVPLISDEVGLEISAAFEKQN